MDPGHLVGEEGSGCFAFLWFVICVLTVLFCLLFLLMGELHSVLVDRRYSILLIKIIIFLISPRKHMHYLFKMSLISTKANVLDEKLTTCLR